MANDVVSVVRTGSPREILHALVYGDSGAGKSTFAATWPKPLLVFAFDPVSKERPYLAAGVAQEVEADEIGTPVRRVIHAKSQREIVRVEHYIDADPTRPEAFQRFSHRMARLVEEYDRWNTIVLDSVTFMDLAARKMHQYYLNPSTKDPRQWYGGSTEALEEMLMIRFGSLPMNVVVIAHVDEDKDEVHGMFVRNPAAPGRLRKRLASGYGELYRAHVKRDAEGNRVYLMQTRTDGSFQASTQLKGLADPVEPSYAALWDR